jgi:tetratricopeptide (TPR) repeat protein
MQSAFINKGFVLNKLEKYQEAIDCFSKAIEIDPTSDVNAYTHMATSLEKLGQYE